MCVCVCEFVACKHACMIVECVNVYLLIPIHTSTHTHTHKHVISMMSQIVEWQLDTGLDRRWRHHHSSPSASSSGFKYIYIYIGGKKNRVSCNKGSVESHMPLTYRHTYVCTNSKLRKRFMCVMNIHTRSCFENKMRNHTELMLFVKETRRTPETYTCPSLARTPRTARCRLCWLKIPTHNWGDR